MRIPEYHDRPSGAMDRPDGRRAGEHTTTSYGALDEPLRSGARGADVPDTAGGGLIGRTDARGVVGSGRIGYIRTGSTRQ